MPDKIFEYKRLAEIYDAFDGQREDLFHYLKIVKALGATIVLDIGCGTGSFTSLLEKEEINVIGVDPALASLEIAKRKITSKKVKWIHGDSCSVLDTNVDLAIMTGNVAQVFLTDKSWQKNITSINNVEARWVFSI